MILFARVTRSGTGSYLKTSPSIMMEQIKGVIPGVIRSFLDYLDHTELMNSKMGRTLLLGFISPRLSLIED
jgi:hypothetical protein